MLSDPMKNRIQPLIPQCQPPEPRLGPAEEPLHTAPVSVRELVESDRPSPSPLPIAITITPVTRHGAPYPSPPEVPSYPSFIVRRLSHDLARPRSGPPARPDPDALKDIGKPPAVVLVARSNDETQRQPLSTDGGVGLDFSRFLCPL